MHLTIFRKGLLLVGLPMAIQLLFIGFLFHVQNEIRSAELWAMHTRDVMEQARVIYRRVVDTVARTQAALINGDVKFGQAVPTVHREIDSDIQHLADFVSDNPPQVTRVHQFGNDADAVLEWSLNQSKLLLQGRAKEFSSLATRRSGEQLISTMGTMLDQILAEEQHLDHVRLERINYLAKLAYDFLAAAAAGSIGVAAIALLAFKSSVAGRLNTLADNAARLAERRPLTPAGGGHDEISTVDSAFHSAAARLAEADAAERTYRTEIEARSAALAQANTWLSRANEELRFKTQENETFVYSVSHDLRSPLVNLQGFSKELARACEDLRLAADDPAMPPQFKSRLSELLDGEILESIRFIQTAVSRSSSIIDSLLRLSRAGRVEYKKQRTEIRPILERIAISLQSSLREHNARITIDDPLPDIEGEPSAIEQIFGNLITNAVNYLDPARPGLIHVGVRSDNIDPHTVRFFVSDNGLGIPTAYLPKLFVAFQRLHGQVAPGEGIGLALVRRVTERLGGSVSVESEEGKGSTFFVTLPRWMNVPAQENFPSPSDSDRKAG